LFCGKTIAIGPADLSASFRHNSAEIQLPPDTIPGISSHRTSHEQAANTPQGDTIFSRPLRGINALDVNANPSILNLISIFLFLVTEMNF